MRDAALLCLSVFAPPFLYILLGFISLRQPEPRRCGAEADISRGTFDVVVPGQPSRSAVTRKPFGVVPPPHTSPFWLPVLDLSSATR